METERSTAPVIVGVDGSSESHQALLWAMEFAAIRKSPLLLVTAYRDEGSDDLRYAPGIVASLEARRRALSGIYDRLTASELEYDHIVSNESIASLIRRHAGGASMVVLGSGPRHRWHQRMRPSLARRLNGRIACPVLSIPSEAPLHSIRPRPNLAAPAPAVAQTDASAAIETETSDLAMA